MGEAAPPALSSLLLLLKPEDALITVSVSAACGLNSHLHHLTSLTQSS